VQKMDKLEINNLTLGELQGILQQDQIPRFRAAQIFRWIHKNGVNNPWEMTNIPQTLKNYINERFYFTVLELVTKQVSRDGTVKYLFRLNDGCTIESVLIPEQTRVTICVSSQVGCAMGCTFCATGSAGFERDLTAGEISRQIELISAESDGITNVVFMGMGEPLHNYRSVLQAVEIMNCSEGMNLGLRRFTISTCGIVPRIYQLADENDQIGLAVSLHAADDAKRKSIMPIAGRYSLAELMAVCRYYCDQTKRRITFEYALIQGFNDGLSDAKALVELLAGLNCHVNLIPINPVQVQYKRPRQQVTKEFMNYLVQHQIPASIRRERGTDIDAACGQLKQATREDLNEDS